ncbi:MAG: acetyltransferase [Candidatus Bathyarchaeia archaeon]|jgi:sugar O-acyltransferase (sialic acid O-acetyltransferase NeuD family)
MSSNINKEKLVIVGDGETAEIAYEYFTHDSNYEVVAFSAEKAYIKKNSLFGLPIIPFEDVENLYNPKIYKMFIAVSFTQLNRVRTRLCKQAKSKGYSLASYISSKAFVWKNVEIGENCFILENNVIQYRAKIGNNVTLWSGNHIGHRAVIKDNCFISSQVTVSGFCEVGENCFIGVNACIADGLKIAKDCIIGAGSVVLKDTFEGLVYVGNPAKPLPNRTSFQTFHVSEEPQPLLIEQKMLSTVIVGDTK